ncbi:MAG: HD domain-containing protein [Bacteroidales bacterium]|nr:HD domain-containing protein [Bacteroidales bacterium]
MTKISSDELLKRIARLAKHNRELEELVKKLEKQNTDLLADNEKLKSLNTGIAGSVKSGKQGGKKGSTSRFDMATVMFAGIGGFSRHVEGMDTSALMDELDEIMCQFDAITSRRGMEKIKTLGDNYLCAGGIPDKNMASPVEAVMAAIEMCSFLDRYEAEKRSSGRIWELRTGIYTGTVTAAVLGKRKLSYDLRGDTVNTVSRMAAVAGGGEILVSAATCELAGELFDCEYFGRLPVKYSDSLQLFRVRRLRPEYSSDEHGTAASGAFGTKLALIRFTDMQEMMLDRLERELPAGLQYHNVKHTVDVVTETELIGWSEGCTDEELLLLKTAALFHDAGHTVSYDNHEYHSTQIARQVLPSYGYTAAQTDRICSIIMATQLPPHPANLLERIICDSDLDYLGRSDFIPVSNTLYEELKALGKAGSLNDWNRMQVRFITGHQYFTATARHLREVNKQQQIERIRSLITDI